MSDPRVIYLNGLSLPHPSPSLFIIYLPFFSPRFVFRSLPNSNGAVWYDLSIEPLSDMRFGNSLLQFVVHYLIF